jgi:hypothetical protein
LKPQSIIEIKASSKQLVSQFEFCAYFTARGEPLGRKMNHFA